jgi:hypothetical protein
MNNGKLPMIFYSAGGMPAHPTHGPELHAMPATAARTPRGPARNEAMLTATDTFKILLAMVEWPGRRLNVRQD